MLGDSCLKTTPVYAKMVDSKMSEDMNALNAKLIS